MKGFLWISGFGVDKEEMEELRKAIRKINRKREEEKREKLDYVFKIDKKTRLSRGLAERR